MRLFWVVLIGFAFFVSGSLIPAAHTMAHAQLASAVAAHADEHHGHHQVQHDDDVKVINFDEHHHAEGHPGDHGAELHLTAISASPFVTKRPAPEAEQRRFYADMQQPSPLLPPDPDPDRA